MELNGVAALELNKDHKNHNHWKDFGDDTFIFCIVRDPVARTIAEFAWWANYGTDNVRTHNEWRDIHCPFYTEEKFLFWLENEYVKNYQTSVVGNNANRINMLIRNESIRGNEDALRQSILKQLGIKHRFEYYPPDMEGGFMDPDSRLLKVVEDSLTIQKLLQEYNQKDMALYAQASDAWVNNSSVTDS